jgi:hypothetical protein
LRSYWRDPWLCREALIEAGASPEKAAKAAEVAEYESRLAEMAADIRLLKWMTGFNLALTVAIVGRLFLTH